MMYALIIDDDKNNLEVLAQMLESQNVESIQLDDPNHLDQVLQKTPDFDVVFLDLEMPETSGYEVLGYLRQKGIDVPVIAYTIHLSQINHARQNGFDGFVGKPLQFKRFPDQLRRILDGQPVWEAK